VKFESISVEFTSLIVAAFRRIPLEYTERIFPLSAIQFKVEISDSIDFEACNDGQKLFL